MTAPPMPHLEAHFDIQIGVFDKPVVDASQVRDGRPVFPAHARQTDMFHFMAGGTQGNELNQLLDVSFVIVLEDFMTLDRPFSSPPPAELTDITGPAKSDLLQPLPLLTRDIGADVPIPGGF